jgi:hypothetical protein
MDNAEAIEILRGTTSPASVLHPQIAADMGADALAAWEWVAKHVDDIVLSGDWRTGDGWVNIYYDDGKLSVGATLYGCVLDAMKKETTDGR